MTGVLRGKTLEEKVYGPGFRPVPSINVVAPIQRCAVEPCTDPIAGSCEVYVDDTPPGIDWYTRMLAKLPVNTWVRLPFCLNHLSDVGRRSVQEQEQPDNWAPWRANPAVFTRPPKLLLVK